MNQPATVLRDPVGGREFRLVRRLGEGGFGEVYLALLKSPGGLEQRVAVKLLRPDVDAGSQAVERLRDEAVVLTRLHHPVILVAHDLVSLGDRIALVTEYVEGQDLGECLWDPVDRIPLAALLDVVAQVGGALDAAWSTARIVHRDVKPANIRIGRHGNVKLLDFGIAKSGVHGREARTQNNVVMGSVAYLAPERFEPSREVHPASDVFALGCVLFEGAAGGRMFQRLDMAQMYGLVKSEAVYDRYLATQLGRVEPAEVRELLRRAFCRDPDRRIPVAELAQAAEGLAASLGGDTLRSWCRKRAWPVAPDVPDAPDPASTPRSAASAGSRSAPAGSAPAGVAGAGTARGVVSASASVSTASASPPSEWVQVPRPPEPPDSPLPVVAGPAVERSPSGDALAARLEDPARASSSGAPAVRREPLPGSSSDTLAAPVPVGGGAGAPRLAWVGAAASAVVVTLGVGGVTVAAVALVVLVLATIPGRSPEPTLPPIHEVGGHEGRDEDPVPGTEVRPAPPPAPVEPPGAAPPQPLEGGPPGDGGAEGSAASAPEANAGASGPDQGRPGAADPGSASGAANDAAPPGGAAAPAAPARRPGTTAVGAVHLVKVVPAELRGAHGTVALPSDAVPAGQWAVFADFGKGWVAAGNVEVAAGAALRLDCNRIRSKCATAP